ncbi:MAG: hypothetical protein H0Z35_06425 [Thermoanaerobacteraceae bacterium]|nr:hypothetical protein [Thermoanaerobacteraceae bacterium]
MLQILFLLLPGLVAGGILAFIFQSILAFFSGIVLANWVTVAVLLVLNNLIYDRLEWR